MPVTAPADKRFLRALARPSRRRPRWRTALVVARTVLVAGACGYVAYRAIDAVQASALLQVRAIAVRGTVRLSAGEVQALVGDLRGQNILRADLARAQGQLLASPWIAAAVLRRRLPSTIEVVVAERRPMGIARLQGALFLVDDRGKVMDEYGPAYAALNLPVIDGLHRVPGQPSALDPARAELAANLLGGLSGRQALLQRVSQVDVSDPRNAVVILDGDPTRVWLGDEQFAERLQNYLELAPTLREQVPALDYVDVRFGERVYVGTTGAAGRAARATGRASGPS